MTTDPALLADFFRVLGHHVHERDGLCWVEVGRLSLMAVPATEAIRVPMASVAGLLRDTGRLAATFVSGGGHGVPAVSWWVRDPGYGLASVQRQFRQNLRAGQRQVHVCPLDWHDFRSQGFRVHCETVAARGGASPPTITPSGWSLLCDFLAAHRSFEALGCFVEGHLAGYLVSLTIDGLCEGMLADCSPRFAAVRPAHWLYHRFAAEMIRRPGIRGVTVGRQGLPARCSLDAFKRHAGYVGEPIHVAAVLHPRWRTVLEPALTRGLLRRSARLLNHRAGILANVSLLDAAVTTRRSVPMPDPEGG